MAIEAALVGKLGDVGRKLHPGRSRNDQVTTDIRLWMRDEIANKIVAVLKYPPLKITLQRHGNFEVRKLRWKDSLQSVQRSIKRL